MDHRPARHRPDGAVRRSRRLIHRYLAPEGGWLRSMEDAGEIFSTVGTGLAVLIAFLIVAAFGHYQAARDAVGKEAVAVQQQYVMATYFDQTDSNALRGEVLCYARAVVDDEWSAIVPSTTAAPRSATTG